jgi:adenine phosphoribosyltransferase
MSEAEDIKYLEERLTKYPDFPVPGIIFRDTFALFGNPEAHRKLIDLFSNHIATLGADVIVGLEARGFILGSAIAYKLNIPFVPIRKKGKLPGKTIAYEYTLEYGTVSCVVSSVDAFWLGFFDPQNCGSICIYCFFM